MWCPAYTMFNVYLPKLLETGYVSGSTEGLSSVPPTKTLEQSLWDVVIFTIGGCPGAIVRLPLFFLEFASYMTLILFK
jgi:hypothetical protein